MNKLLPILLLVLSSCAAPVAAAETCFTYEATVQKITAAPAPIQEIPADKLADFIVALEATTGDKYEGITRAFVATRNDGVTVVGLEKDGCLLPAIFIGGKPAGPSA